MACRVTNTTGLPLTDEYSCKPGFYCPFANSTIPESIPQMCVPDLNCQATRLLSASCKPQGKYEPMVCPPGYYCHDSKTIQICPPGHFCPSGSQHPLPCSSLASCPQGSFSELYYGGLVICLVIDVLLVLIVLITRRVHPSSSSSSTTAPKANNNNNKHHNGLLKQFSKKEKESPAQNHYTIPDQMKSELLLDAFSKGLGGKQMSMRFTFDNLALQVKNKDILQGMTGEIKPGKLTAIMGPSGAGKTTFMNVLMGKVKKSSGDLFINSTSMADLSKFKKIIGFVPQEDVMLRELTVYENILHSARCRLPSSWNPQEVKSHVDTIIKALDLEHVKHVKIGDETSRGISGGQRKRVNIGMELAAIPISLFLDEPTSGLDSTAALSVTEILKNIASLGQTVVAVMHQPRFEIFSQVDELLLIVPGGKVAYMGPADLAQEYFKELGYKFPDGCNPADIMMDILSKDSIKNNLPQRWINYTSKTSTSPVPRTNSVKSASEGEFFRHVSMLLKERCAYWYQQVWWCHNRYLVQQERYIGSLALEIFVGLAAGFLMGISVNAWDGELYKGLLIEPYTILSSAPVEFIVPLYGLLIGFCVVLCGAPAGVKVFSEEKPVYWREASSGHSQSAYYIGKTIATVPRFVISSFHFTSMYVYFAAPTFPTFTMMYKIILLTFFGVYGMSTFVSCIVSRGNANLLAVVFGIFAASFSGFGPTLRDVNDWGVGFLWELSFNKWGTEALFSSTLRPTDIIYQTQITADSYGYTLGQEGFDLLMMLVIGVAFRILAYAALRLTNRDKQK